MDSITKENLDRALEKIGEAVLASLSFSGYPSDKLDKYITLIDEMSANPAYLKETEQYLKSTSGNHVLFFISNIIYNLKAKTDLNLTPETLKWLGSVMKNFLKRNRSYQQYFSIIDTFRKKFEKYFPGEKITVNKIDNVNIVKEDYIQNEKGEAELKELEGFFHITSELMAWMKSTYFFLEEYYAERGTATGESPPEAQALRNSGLAGFGQKNYTYRDILILCAESLAMLEAVYLTLKKKKSARRVVVIEGEQKFLNIPEIYDLYLEKFNALKKEISGLNK